ncbi:hypothetical protein ACUXJ9_001195 [Staphylococcus caledonicus]|uniref:cell surface protein n=1 Tax=Staphylococcus caledonicus TaxID=2741333 RepID=UPI003C2F76B8
MKKVSLLVLTVLIGTVILCLNSNHALAAEMVTKDNAQQVAQEAMSNSGGNPDLQNFGKAIDKGNYFEIESHNKANSGVGVYRVYKTGEVEYKNDKFSDFNQLASEDTHAEHGIAKAAELDNPSPTTSDASSVDNARELNTYYVGNVASTEVPSSKTNTHQSTSNKTLPQTGDANHHQPIQALGSSLFLLGSLILINLTTRKTA